MDGANRAVVDVRPSRGRRARLVGAAPSLLRTEAASVHGRLALLVLVLAIFADDFIAPGIHADHLMRAR